MVQRSSTFACHAKDRGFESLWARFDNPSETGGFFVVLFIYETKSQKENK